MQKETNINNWICYYYTFSQKQKGEFHYIGNSLIETTKNTLITTGNNASDIFIQEIDCEGKLIDVNLVELENVESGNQFLFRLSNEVLLLIGRGYVKREKGDEIDDFFTFIKINANNHSIISAKKIFLQNLGLGDFYVVEDIDKNYIICGTYNWGTNWGAEDSDNDILLIKIDSEGKIKWAKTFGGLGFDLPLGLTQSSDGGVLVCGFTESFGKIFASRGGFILKVDGLGELNFLKLYGNSKESNRINFVTLTNSGYFAGGNIGDEFKMLLLDKTGSVNKTCSYKGNIGFYSIFNIGQNEYIAAGGKNSEAIISLMDSEMNMKWLKSYGDEKSNYSGFIVESVITNCDNYLILAGWEDFGLKGTKHAVMKINLDGTISNNCQEIIKPLKIPRKLTSEKISVEDASDYPELKQRNIDPKDFEIFEISFKSRDIKDSVIVEKICGN